MYLSYGWWAIRYRTKKLSHQAFVLCWSKEETQVTSSEFMQFCDIQGFQISLNSKIFENVRRDWVLRWPRWGTLHFFFENRISFLESWFWFWNSFLIFRNRNFMLKIANTFSKSRFYFRNSYLVFKSWFHFQNLDFDIKRQYSKGKWKTSFFQMEIRFFQVEISFVGTLQTIELDPPSIWSVE